MEESVEFSLNKNLFNVHFNAFLYGNRKRSNNIAKNIVRDFLKLQYRKIVVITEEVWEPYYSNYANIIEYYGPDVSAKRKVEAVAKMICERKKYSSGCKWLLVIDWSVLKPLENGIYDLFNYVPYLFNYVPLIRSIIFCDSLADLSPLNLGRCFDSTYIFLSGGINSSQLTSICNQHSIALTPDQHVCIEKKTDELSFVLLQATSFEGFYYVYTPKKIDYFRENDWKTMTLILSIHPLWSMLPKDLKKLFKTHFFDSTF